LWGGGTHLNLKRYGIHYCLLGHQLCENGVGKFVKCKEHVSNDYMIQN